MNAYSGFKDGEARCVVLRKPSVEALTSRHVRHTALCEHDLLQWKCHACRDKPMWWTKDDFLSTKMS